MSILHELTPAWKSWQIKDGESSVWADMAVSSHINFLVLLWIEMVSLWVKIVCTSWHVFLCRMVWFCFIFKIISLMRVSWKCAKEIFLPVSSISGTLNMESWGEGRKRQCPYIPFHWLSYTFCGADLVRNGWCP